MGAEFRELMEKIENCRNQMVQLALETSLCNHQVIETSKRLDHLLNQLPHKK